MKFDVVIAGGRCAGAATAMLIARAGGKVLVLDKGDYGTDTLSTHALMRGGVVQLHRWGVLPAIIDAGTPPIRSTTFEYEGLRITIPIESKFGVDALYAPRRALLDRLLANAAYDAGAELEYRCDVQEVLFDAQDRACGVVVLKDGRTERIAADLIIGADGRHSTIARRVGAATLREARHSTGVLYTYWLGLDSDAYLWGYQKDASIGLIPTNDGAACVFVAVPFARFREEPGAPAPAAYRRFIRTAFPALDLRLREARPIEPVRGFAGQHGFIRQGSGPGWALVGDAGYFKDPITAHGITDALRDAELLARAAIRGTPDAFDEYDQMRLDLSSKLFDVTDQIASFTWTDSEVQALHRALSVEMSREVRRLVGLEPKPVLAEF